MHARKLVELAGWISVHSGSLLREEDASNEALAEYWIASRCRLDEWGRALRRLGDSHTADPESLRELQAVAEEIVLSDVLTRAVAAITYSVDNGDPVGDRSAIGRNTLEAHTDTLSRLRALTCVWWPGDSPKARWLRSLSARAERWNDALISYFNQPGLLNRLAHSASRLHDFAEDRRLHGADAKAASALLSLAIRTNFSSSTPAVCGELNRRIGGAALGLFGPATFDGFGLPRSAWMIRVERTTEETVALLDSFFSGDFRQGEPKTPLRWRL